MEALMQKKTVKLSVGAMQLVDEGCMATVKFAEGDATQSNPSLEMVGYSGGIIKGHWWWGDLAIDLTGMSFPKTKFPILEEHQTDKKIAFIKKSDISTEGNKLSITGGTFLDSPESMKFQSDSAKGFPFEASIYARPSQIQTLAENEVADVNGYQMKGPGTIWRKSTFKEVSVCTFGYDSNTSARSMSESEEMSIEYKEAVKLTHEEEESMDFMKFKADHPEEAAKFAAEITDALTVKFAEEKSALETKLADAVSASDMLSKENTELEKRTLKLELAEEGRQAHSIKLSADSAFAEKFAEAGLPDRLSGKIRKLVDHTQFVADGKFDTDAFAAAVDAELKDWAGDDESSVQGFSTSTKTHGEDTAGKDGKAVDDAVARMKAHIS
jgi:hypothetical protein